MNEVTHQKCGTKSNNLAELNAKDYNEFDTVEAFCPRCLEQFDVILEDGYWRVLEDEMMTLETVEDFDETEY